MLTLETILKLTNPVSVHESSGIRLANLQAPTGTDSPLRYHGVVQGRSGRSHRAEVEFYGPAQVQTPVVVSCTCESFSYNLALPLSIHGSSRSRGHARVPVNQLRPGLCVHLLGLIRVILRGSNGSG